MRFLIIPALLVCCSTAVKMRVAEADYEKYLKALPDLNPITAGNEAALVVRYVENPDLLSLDQATRTKLYRMVEKYASDAYKIQLKITEEGAVKMADYFKSVEAWFNLSPIGFPAQSYLISWFALDRESRIAETIAATLKQHDAAKIKEYLGENASLDALTAKFIITLGKIYSEKDLRGRPLLFGKNRDTEPRYSFGHWSTILQGEKTVDFILTNGGIIGADNGMPIYVIARGGVTSAFVENNAHRPYQGVGVLGLYPFLAETKFFTEKRGLLTPEEKLEAIAWVWLHELGHLLFKKSENYTFADSVHRAPPDLRYYEWAKRVRASRNHHTNEISNMKKF